MKDEYPVTTICGSMRYFDMMLEVAHDLTEMGYIVLMPLVKVIEPKDQPTSSTKQMLDEMHLVKIDMSNSIHVVGKYKGESTRKEIEYAIEHGKIVHHVEKDPINGGYHTVPPTE